MNAICRCFFFEDEIERLEDAPKDTSSNYKTKGYKASFTINSSVRNPFCDSCNRLRLTANGQLKNCLFSTSKCDLLTTLRSGKPSEPKLHNNNRSVFTIGDNYTK